MRPRRPVSKGSRARSRSTTRRRACASTRSRPDTPRRVSCEEWLGLQDDPAATLESVLESIPLGRIADPREIGNAVVFLLSDQASAITGATLAVDCGIGARFAT